MPDGMEVVAGDASDPRSSLQTGVTTNDSFNLGTLLCRSTGERFTLSFSGRGFVIV